LTREASSSSPLLEGKGSATGGGDGKPDDMGEADSPPARQPARAIAGGRNRNVASRPAGRRGGGRHSTHQRTRPGRHAACVGEWRDRAALSPSVISSCAHALFSLFFHQALADRTETESKAEMQRCQPLADREMGRVGIDIHGME